MAVIPALTLTQPWATLVAIGAKRVETRSWATNYRGPIAIHAAKGPGELGWMQLNHIARHTEPFASVLKLDRHPAEALPLGAVIAVAQLVDCCPMASQYEQRDGEPDIFAVGYTQLGKFVAVSDQERAFGDYGPRRYAWLLADVRRLPKPIPARGAQRLWRWEMPEGIDG